MSLLLTLIFLSILFLSEYFRKSLLVIDLFRLFLIWYSLCYFVVPEAMPFQSECHPYCDGAPLLPRIVSLIGLLALLVGYKLSIRIPVFKIKEKLFLNPDSNLIFNYCVVMCSVIALVVYASSFGGFVIALSEGAIMRYTGQQVVEVGGSSVAMYFVTMVSITLVTSQWEIANNTKNPVRWRSVFIVSALTLVIFSIIQASRGQIFGAFLIYLYIYINANEISFLSMRKSTVKFYLILIFVVIFGLIFTLYGKVLIGNASGIVRGDATNVVIEENLAIYAFTDRLTREFSHPFKSLDVVINSDLAPNWFKHFFYAPLHLVPTRLLGLSSEKPYRITEENTYLLTGEVKGGIPPGLLASFWYGGNLFGIVLCMFLSGLVLNFIQRQGYALLRNNAELKPIVLYVFFTVANFVNNGDPSVFLKDSFNLFAFTIIMSFFLIARKLRFSF